MSVGNFKRGALLLLIPDVGFCILMRLCRVWTGVQTADIHTAVSLHIEKA